MITLFLKSNDEPCQKTHSNLKEHSTFRTPPPIFSRVHFNISARVSPLTTASLKPAPVGEVKDCCRHVTTVLGSSCIIDHKWSSPFQMKCPHWSGDWRRKIRGSLDSLRTNWRGFQYRPQRLRSQDTKTSGQLRTYRIMDRRGAVCWVLGLLLLGHTGRLCSAEEVTSITGIRGGSVFLSPAVPLEFNPREFFWRHLSPTDHLVASFSRGSLDTTYQSCFHGRVQLLENMTLEVSGLELKDTGMFTCQMVDTQGHMKLYQFHLMVYEKASKPEVQVFVSRQGEDCAIFLSCNATAGSNVTYSWMNDTGQGDLLNNTYRLYDDKRLLRTTLASTHQHASFICVVTNPVSRQHTSVVPWASCLAKSGQDVKMNNGKIVIFVAASLIIMFTTGMICVYFFTRSSGKTPGNGRERITMNTEETILHLQEETEALVNEQTGPPHLEETTAWHNGEVTLGHNAEGGSNEGNTKQLSPETTVTHKVETIV